MIFSHCWIVVPWLIVGTLSCLPLLAEEIRVATRAELTDALRNAKPGTTILVAGGSYAGGLSQARLQGTKDQPIVVAGADLNQPPIISGGGSGLHLSSPAHIELRDLVIEGSTGNGLNIDDSGNAETPAHDIVLRNIRVRNVGPRGNSDGIKLSGLATFRIEGCEVRQWGDGGSAIDMVGCRSGVVRDCVFRDARGEFANGIQAKGGSREIVVQRCRFENAGGRAVNAGGSTGAPFFRPTDATFEAQNMTVEDCEFLGGTSAIAFVGVDGAIVRHNTIFRPRRWALRILQENGNPRFTRCRNGQFINNLIVFRADEIREIVNIGGNTDSKSFTFSGNHWHCLDRPTDTRRLVRLPVAEKAGRYDAAPPLANPEKGDLSIVGRRSDDAGVRERTR